MRPAQGRRSLLLNGSDMDVMPALTAEHLEPWNGNIVDLTMIDGTHRIGLLQRVDRNWVRLKTGRGEPNLPNGGLIQIDQTTVVARAWRN